MRYWIFSFIVSELVQVNPDNSLAECVNLQLNINALVVLMQIILVIYSTAYRKKTIKDCVCPVKVEKKI